MSAALASIFRIDSISTSSCHHTTPSALSRRLSRYLGLPPSGCLSGYSRGERGRERERETERERQKERDSESYPGICHNLCNLQPVLPDLLTTHKHATVRRTRCSRTKESLLPPGESGSNAKPMAPTCAESSELARLTHGSRGSQPMDCTTV